MDASSFDNFARLAATVSRRSAFASTFVSALVALAAVALHSADEAAAKKRNKSKCTPSCGINTCGDDGCGGSCGDCEPNATCEDGTCVCVPDCDGSSCGDDGCGETCPCDDQSFCQAGSCVPCHFPCPAGQ